RIVAALPPQVRHVESLRVARRPAAQLDTHPRIAQERGYTEATNNAGPVGIIDHDDLLDAVRSNLRHHILGRQAGRTASERERGESSRGHRPYVGLPFHEIGDLGRHLWAREVVQAVQPRALLPISSNPTLPANALGPGLPFRVVADWKLPRLRRCHRLYLEGLRDLSSLRSQPIPERPGRLLERRHRLRLGCGDAQAFGELDERALGSTAVANPPLHAKAQAVAVKTVRVAERAAGTGVAIRLDLAHNVAPEAGRDIDRCDDALRHNRIWRTLSALPGGRPAPWFLILRTRHREGRCAHSRARVGTEAYGHR